MSRFTAAKNDPFNHLTSVSVSMPWWVLYTPSTLSNEFRDGIWTIRLSDSRVDEFEDPICSHFGSIALSATASVDR